MIMYVVFKPHQCLASLTHRSHMPNFSTLERLTFRKTDTRVPFFLEMLNVEVQGKIFR